MTQRTLSTFAILGVIFLVLSGCASTGSSAGGGSSPAAAAAAPAAPAAPDYKAEMGDNGLPTVRAILARYVDAVGGEDAVRAHKSSTVKGKFLLSAMGVEGELTIKLAAPDKMHQIVETPMGSIESGYNGEVGWSINPFTGDTILDGTALAAAKAQADYYAQLNYDAHYTTQETLEETDFEGEAAYKVKLVDGTGGETIQYYSKESSLMIGMEATQEGPQGAAEVTIKIADYKDFGGVLVATKQTTSVQGMDIENVIESITYDELTDSDFELPASIQSKL